MVLSLIFTPTAIISAQAFISRRPDRRVWLLAPTPLNSTVQSRATHQTKQVRAASNICAAGRSPLQTLLPLP